MFTVSAYQVKKRKPTVCKDCGRPICEGEYATKLTEWDPYYHKVTTRYSCCTPPQNIKVVEFKEAYYFAKDAGYY